MTITISGWIGFLIGCAAGVIFGIICGVCLSDRWWRKNVKNYSHLIPSMTDNKREVKKK